MLIQFDVPAYPHTRISAYPHIRIPAYPHTRISAYPHTRISAYPHIRIPAFSTKPIHVANVLAWNYHFNFVDNALKRLYESFCSGTYFYQPNVKLSLNKLLLLIFPDGIAINDLSEVDSKIERRSDISTAGLPLYCITSGEAEYLLVVQNVKEPLVSLIEIFGRNKKLIEHDINYQVKLFTKTLSDLLARQSTNSFRDMCIVVPIIGKGLDSLKDGKLADLIIEQAKGAKTINKADISNGPPTSNGPSTSSGPSTSNGSQLEPEDSSEGDGKPNSNLLRRGKHSKDGPRQRKSRRETSNKNSGCDDLPKSGDSGKEQQADDVNSEPVSTNSQYENDNSEQIGNQYASYSSVTSMEHIREPNDVERGMYYNGHQRSTRRAFSLRSILQAFMQFSTAREQQDNMESIALTSIVDDEEMIGTPDNHTLEQV